MKVIQFFILFSFITVFVNSKILSPTLANKSSLLGNEIDQPTQSVLFSRNTNTRRLTSRILPRGFLNFNILESTLYTLGKFFGKIMGVDDDDDDFDENNYKNMGVNYKDYQLIRIMPKNRQHIEYLQELKESEPTEIKFWTYPAENKNTDILVSPVILNDVKEFFQEKEIDYLILITDLQKVINLQNPIIRKERRQDSHSLTTHRMSWIKYHRYNDIIQYLDYLANRYPSFVQVSTIGQSFEGRDLRIVKISTGTDKNGKFKPSIWIDAGMHAREWISTAVATYIINQLVEKKDNYTKLLDITDWIIMPMANPDGYEYTHTNDRLWRKTRSVQDSTSASRQNTGFLHMLTHYTKWLFGSCEGVDLNRNFDIHWGEDKVGGASFDPCHDTYKGPHAFSEIETKAIADYIMKNKKNIRTYITLHSYSQMLLVPWGFTNVKPEDFDDLMNIARKAKKAIAKVHGTDYRIGSAAKLLYPTTGSSDDWAKASAGINYAYTLELRDTGKYGFLLPADQIIPTAREAWAGIRVIARMSTSSSHN